MEGDWPRVGGRVFLNDAGLVRARHLGRLFCLLALLILSANVRADLAAGLDAYRANDYPAALKAFKPLAEKGNADAQVNLGFLYARGHGVPQDYKAAANWYRKAAEQGQSDAQFNLGSLHYDGLGVARDLKQAAVWYAKAAESGQIDAQYNLGLMYVSGQGVPASMQQAYKWLSIAAALGDQEAEESKKLAAAKMSREEIDAAQALVQAWWALRK